SKELVGLLLTSKKYRQLAKAHIQRRITWGRNRLESLFDPDNGRLYNICQSMYRETPQSVSSVSNPFNEEKSNNTRRMGWFLAYTAVAILNICDARCYQALNGTVGKQDLIQELRVVVVTTLVIWRGKVILVVALNGGSRRCRQFYQ